MIFALLNPSKASRHCLQVCFARIDLLGAYSRQYGGTSSRRMIHSQTKSGKGCIVDCSRCRWQRIQLWCGSLILMPYWQSLRKSWCLTCSTWNDGIHEEPLSSTMLTILPSRVLFLLRFSSLSLLHFATVLSYTCSGFINEVFLRAKPCTVVLFF